jgi:hypothetical protein
MKRWAHEIDAELSAQAAELCSLLLGWGRGRGWKLRYLGRATSGSNEVSKSVPFVTVSHRALSESTR